MSDFGEEWGRPLLALRIFISSPNNVRRERDIACEVIRQVDDAEAREHHFALEIIDWRRWGPGGDPPEVLIPRYLNEDCDFFLLIMADKFGTPPSPRSRFGSGTEMEYIRALSLRRTSPSGERPKISVYFRDIDEHRRADAGPQLRKVLEFRERVQKETTWAPYSEPAEFRPLFQRHLTRWVHRLREQLGEPSPRDPRAPVLKKFFGLGAPKTMAPRAMIVFPPETRTVGKVDITHLLPYMVLEDYQAIEKVYGCLTLAGCSEIRVRTTERYDKDRARPFNKVFLCVPRNKAAQNCLCMLQGCGQTDLSFQPRFRLQEKTEADSSFLEILWTNEHGNLVIRSPQSHYLKAQRKARSGWKFQPGRCFAVDFAVVARFENPENRDFPQYGALSKTFLFGIRGLGTWGAAWYLTNRYSHLAEALPDRGPFQALLRVEYSNYSIRKVEDVSERDQAYFSEQIDPEYIKSELAKWSASIGGRSS